MVEKVGYSVEETMQATGLGRSTVYELLGSGELESIKVGRRRIVPADAITQFMNAKRAATADKAAAELGAGTAA